MTPHVIITEPRGGRFTTRSGRSVHGSPCRCPQFSAALTEVGACAIVSYTAAGHRRRCRRTPTVEWMLISDWTGRRKRGADP